MDDFLANLIDILFGLVLIAITVVVAYRWIRPTKVKVRRESSDKETCEKPDMTAARSKAVVKQALLQMQVKIRGEKDNDDTLIFDYQGGNFVLWINPERPTLTLLTLGFVETAKLDYVSEVRMLCNDFNRRFATVSAYYVPESSDNSLYISLNAMLPVTEHVEDYMRIFKHSAEECFVGRRFVYDHLHNLMQMAEKYDRRDVEYFFTRDEAVRHVVAESERKFCDEKFRLKITAPSFCAAQSVGHWLFSTDLLPCTTPVKMEVRGEGYEYVTTEIQNIKQYLLHTPLTAQTGGGDAPKEFARQNAVIVLTLARDHKPREEVLLYLMLQARLTTREALFYRLTYSIPDATPGRPSVNTVLEDHTLPMNGSMTLAYDLVSEPAKRAEFEYMWGEVQDKGGAGKENDFTPEQDLLAGLTDKRLGTELYWGNRLMREKRFYDASYRFERAYRMQTGTYMRMNEAAKRTFQETCYLLGTCLLRIGLYKQAYYYLQMNEEESTFKHTEQLINCMLAADDPRTLQAVQTRLQFVSQHIRYMREEMEDVSPELTVYEQILRRKEVEAYMQNGMNTEAMSLCKTMLKEKDNYDFALEKLIILKKKQDATDGTEDHKNGADTAQG